MSAKSNEPKISEILLAFFRLDESAQRAIHEQVQRLTDPRTSKVERDRAERTLATLLRSVPEQCEAGHLVGREQRLTSEQRELRARMEQAEAAFTATLTRLMAERQLTQADLARRIGVGQSAIAMLLKRRCRPQRRTLGKLAEALNVAVDELWPGFSSGWKSGVM